MGLAEKLLIVPFVCPLITFFFFSAPARLWLGRNAGISRFLLSAAVLRGSGGSGRRLVFESRLKYATTDFFFFFFHNSQALSLLYISLCVGLPVNVSVSMCVFPVWLGLAGDCIPPPPPPTIHPLHPLPLVCAAYGHCDGG